MTRKIITLALVLPLWFAPTVTQAQGVGDGQRIVVPLSDPAKPVELQVSLIAGSIDVTAYYGKEVIVIARTRETRKQEQTRDGMRVIPNTSIGLTAEEKNNSVSIGADWNSRPVDLEIQVPSRTSARLSTINSGNIAVRGLSGELELQNVNGAIRADDIRGSVVANTTNGDVLVNLVEVARDKEMAFNSFNGDVELILPVSLRADLKISAGQGDILTNFEVEQQPVEPRIERESSGGSHRVRMSNEIHLKIGGGGPTYRIETFNGDVSIQKAK